jgi:hypothetical protein
MPLPVLDTFQGYFDIRPRTGLAIEQADLTVAASQTIKFGDFLVWASGTQTLEQAIALPATNTYTAGGGGLLIVGVAMADIITNASGVEAVTGRTTIPVATVDYIQIALNIYNATAANAEPRDLTPGGGTSYELGRYTGASSAVNGYFLSTTTTGELAYDEPVLGVSQTTDYGPVWCHVLPASNVY